MKVLFIARPDLYKVPGGDTVQMEGTAKYLRRLGVTVEIHAGYERADTGAYDLLHFFNIIDPEDLLGYALQTAKPYVISTIYVDYSEYDREHRKDLIGILSRVFPYHAIEYFKTLAKYFLKGEKLSSLQYLWRGHAGSIRYLLKHAACLLPNSEHEYQRLLHDFGMAKTYAVVPNAIDPDVFPARGNEEERKGVLCVARIEGRKNQLNLVRAMKDLPLELHLVGKTSPNQQAYAAQCKLEAGNNIFFHEQLDQQALAGLYRKAKVHVLPSWFETTGLSSLEAAAMGCNIVVSDKGDVKDYFGDLAYYCDPGDPGDIAQAVVRACEEPVKQELREKVFRDYTWEQAAQRTLEAYRMVLNR